MNSGMSWREHLILGRIEEGLRSDRVLARALSTMQLPCRQLTDSRILTFLVVVLIGFAIGLTIAVLQSGVGSALVFLALVLNLVLMVSSVLVAWRRGRRGGSGIRPGPASQPPTERM